MKSGKQVHKTMRELKEGDVLHTGSPAAGQKPAVAGVAAWFRNGRSSRADFFTGVS